MAVNHYLFTTENLLGYSSYKRKVKYKSVIATTTDLPKIFIYLIELTLLSHVYIGINVIEPRPKNFKIVVCVIEPNRK